MQEAISRPSDTSCDEAIEQLKREWTAQQLELASRAIFYDDRLSFEVSRGPDYVPDDLTEPVARRADQTVSGLTCAGGLDISFPRYLKTEGIATLTVLSFPELKLLHSVSKRVAITQPYIPSFLAMREASILIGLISDLRQTSFKPLPQIYIIDGNGRFHIRQAGLAVAIGVAVDAPTIGVAKEYNPLHGQPSKLPTWRQTQKGFREKSKAILRKRADWIGLHDACGMSYHGAALLASQDKSASQPVYVSPGHRLSLETSIAVTLACSIARVPEPVRQADALSRKLVMETFGCNA